MAKGRKLTDVKKIAIVRAYVRAEPVKDIAKANNVSETTIRLVVGEAKRTGLLAKMESELTAAEIERRIMLGAGGIEVRYVFTKLGNAEKDLNRIENLVKDTNKKMAEASKDVSSVKGSLKSFRSSFKAFEQSMLIAENFVKANDEKISKLASDVSALKSREEKMEKVAKEMKNLDQVVDLLKTRDERIDRLSDNIRALEESVELLRTRSGPERLERDVKVLEQEISSLKMIGGVPDKLVRDVKAVENELYSLKDSVAGSEEKIDRIYSDLKRKEDLLLSLEPALKMLEQSIVIFDKYKKENYENMLRMSGEINEVKKSIAAMETSVRNTGNVAEVYESSSRIIDENFERLGRRVSELAAENEMTKNSLKAAEKRMFTLDNHSKDVNETLARLSNIMKVMEQNMLVFENHVKTYDDILDSHGRALKELKDSMEAFEAGIRHIDEIKAHLEIIKTGLNEIRKRQYIPVEVPVPAPQEEELPTA